ncbi:CHAT domain-containing protein [Oscillatoria salina]|uniref:CHAT domain-containing protein n=1 Tax=Oscillatoria salina TaxID=331517 RepID=UPI001CCD9848|nr:CHAT domain-containing protein [Oscillatoria salina]MBZ8182611.1 CHAT domain-containing protein [Oscillatoria salina IIICB1]
MNKILALSISILILGISGQIKPASAKNNSIFLLAQTTNLEAEAQQLYQQGKYQASIELLEQAIANYAAQGDNYRQATALRNLALVNLKIGEWEKTSNNIISALDILNNLSETKQNQQLKAATFDIKGQLELTIGQPELALETWKQAAEIYRNFDLLSDLTKSKINQAQALQALGLYATALTNLNEIRETLQAEPDSLIKAKALQSLGDVLRGVGQLQLSQELLQSSLEIAENLGASEQIAISLISLGNTTRLLQETDTASLLYQRVIEETFSPELQTQAQLNQLNLLIDQKDYDRAIKLIPSIDNLLTQLPQSQTKVYARINFAESLTKLRKDVKNKQNLPSAISASGISKILATAIQEARNLGDRRAESSGLGNLGKLYQQNQQWDEAKEITEQALILAQGINAPDLAYQWQWQLGKILAVKKERKGAINAYSQAVDNLKALRSDIVAISSEVQYDFRESVEPVYRELVSLLLQPNQPGENPTQENLKQAREIIESLQLAELDNFFRDACLDAQPVTIDQLDRKAAIFYPIILADRLEVILALPDRPLISYTTNLPKAEIEATIQEMFQALTNPRERRFIENFLEPSQKVYNWLIRPIEKELKSSDIETIVLVPDGRFRNIPIATLHDGEKYLAETYSVATAPSLQLVDPKPLAREKIQVLSGGLSEARQGFAPLPGVADELAKIQSQVPTEILINESFTEPNVNQQVTEKAYPVVHLATHGEFSSQVENTFVLTWNEKINIEDLRNLLKSDTKQIRPIELLVLSACQTAAGDDRAALGLAGVAVRAGARSTVASLWYVSDEGTSLLMTNFYRELTNPEISKAEALRRAQVQVLAEEKFAHPYFWSAFVLVGNWL